MPLATTGHRLAAGAVATLVLLTVVAAGVVWRAGDADATAPVDVATAGTSTTSSSSTTTSTTTTSTTVEPKPTTTAAPPRTTVPGGRRSPPRRRLPSPRR